jgi:hypothetical protein
VLCATNENADIVNTKHLNMCKNEVFTFQSDKSSIIHLKVGARVQLTRNIYDKTNNTLLACNGVMGTIQRIAPSTQNATVTSPIKLTKDNIWCCVINTDMQTPHDDVKTITIYSVPTQKLLTDIEITEETKNDDGPKQYAFPLRLAYGVTIHCMQGQTLQRGVIDGDNLFAGQSQIYTAFSRFANLRHIYLHRLDAYSIQSAIQRKPMNRVLKQFITQYKLT